MRGGAIRPAVLRVYQGNDCHATSAVICQGKFVICPAVPLLLLRVGNDVQQLEDVLRAMDQEKVCEGVVDLYRDSKCVVLPPGGKIEVPSVMKFIFHSRAIRETFLRLFSSSPSLKLFKGDTLTPGQRALLLSSFLVCELSQKVGQEEEEKKKFSESHRPPNSDFCVIATPYGNALMQGSAFKCRVANVVNDVLYLIDQPLSRGCEGGLLWSPLSEPLGLVLTTTFETQNENLNLTFAGNLREILRGVADEKFEVFPLLLPRDTATQSVVLIESGRNSYGTGALIRVEKKRLILTCSHVVTDNEKNFCTWNGRLFPLRLVYKNPQFDRPFDVAVFEAPKEIPNAVFCRAARKNPMIGITVRQIGFPVFHPVAVNDLQLLPSVYRGKLVNYRAGMIISDVMIQSGQSGGPLFDDQDQMVGIVVSNFRENDTGRVFPALNCSVPMFNIIPYLTEYSDKNDEKCLRKLEGTPYLRRLWNFEEPVVHSKM